MIAACLPHILGHIQSDLTGHLERCPFGILPFPGKKKAFLGWLCVGKIGFFYG